MKLTHLMRHTRIDEISRRDLLKGAGAAALGAAGVGASADAKAWNAERTFKNNQPMMTPDYGDNHEKEIAHVLYDVKEFLGMFSHFVDGAKDDNPSDDLSWFLQSIDKLVSKTHQGSLEALAGAYGRVVDQNYLGALTADDLRKRKG